MGEPPPSPPHDSQLLPLVVGIALYALTVLTALQPLQEYDTWWHLRTGHWVAENGTVPVTDPFTQGGEHGAWVAYSWLLALTFYGLYQAVGLTGILLFRVLFAVAIVGALHRLALRRGAGLRPTALLLAAAVVALTPALIGERPWLVSILFCTLTLDAVLTLQEGRSTRLVWLLPLMYAVWANVHIQFAHGLFILGLACAGPVVDRVLGRAAGAEGVNAAGSPAWWRLVLLTALCTAATLGNPYHVRLYEVIFHYVGHKKIYGLFPELQSLTFRQPSDWAALALFGVAAFALGRLRPLRAFDLLLLCRNP